MLISRGNEGVWAVTPLVDHRPRRLAWIDLHQGARRGERPGDGRSSGAARRWPWSTRIVPLRCSLVTHRTLAC